MSIDNPIAVVKPNILLDGIITVKLVNGRHFTYRISTPKSGYLKDRQIVELLVGPNNQQDYKGWGFITKTGAIRIWNKQYTEAFIKHAELLMGLAENHVSEWFQAGRCMKCGRVLTDPDSIELGMGPVCGGKV